LPRLHLFMCALCLTLFLGRHAGVLLLLLLLRLWLQGQTRCLLLWRCGLLLLWLWLWHSSPYFTCCSCCVCRNKSRRCLSIDRRPCMIPNCCGVAACAGVIML
jgi:hypothetical protein